MLAAQGPFLLVFFAHRTRTLPSHITILVATQEASPFAGTQGCEGRGAGHGALADGRRVGGEGRAVPGEVHALRRGGAQAKGVPGGERREVAGNDGKVV